MGVEFGNKLKNHELEHEGDEGRRVWGKGEIETSSPQVLNETDVFIPRGADSKSKVVADVAQGSGKSLEDFAKKQNIQNIKIKSAAHILELSSNSNTARSAGVNPELLKELLKDLSSKQDKKELEKDLAVRIGRLSSAGVDPELLKGLLSKQNKEDFEKDLAAIEYAQKHAARLKGRLVRKKVVQTTQLNREIERQLGHLKTLQDAALGPEQRLNLSRAIARQILDVAENPAKYAEYGLRLNEGESYKFPKFDSKNKAVPGGDVVQLPCNIWVSLSPDKKSIEVEIQGQKLGSGGFNEVFQAPILIINMSQSQHAMKAERFVTRRSLIKTKQALYVKPDTPFEEIPEKIRNNPEFRAAGVTSHTDRKLGTGQVEARDLEGKPDWYRLTHAQQIQILVDAAKTLSLLHTENFVHRDIKWENIIAVSDPNLKENDPEKYRGHIIDWDMLNTVGVDKGAKGTKGYADPLAFKGTVTPLTDVYALAKVVIHFYNHRKATKWEKESDKSSGRYVELIRSAKKLLSPKYQGLVSGIIESLASMVVDSEKARVIRYGAGVILQQPYNGKIDSSEYVFGRYQRFLKALEEYNKEIQKQ